MATYVGTVYNDTYTGGAQTQYGLDGNDTLSPRSKYDNKSYFLYGGNGNDTLVAFNYNDQIYGGRGSDYLQGYGGDDFLEGGSGNDELHGDYGNDILSGGIGSDNFIFDSKLNANKNTDTITDFDGTYDTILLDNAIFQGIGGSGQFLPANRFVIGSEATTDKQRIIYNDNNGRLYYDPDGSGSADKIRFAVLDKDLPMTNTDFYII